MENTELEQAVKSNAELLAKLKKIRIVGDGTNNGTQIFDAETGERINFVKRISFDLRANSNAKVRLVTMEVLCHAEFDMLCDDVAIDPAPYVVPPAPLPPGLIALSTVPAHKLQSALATGNENHAVDMGGSRFVYNREEISAELKRRGVL